METSKLLKLIEVCDYVEAKDKNSNKREFCFSLEPDGSIRVYDIQTTIDDVVPKSHFGILFDESCDWKIVDSQ